MNGLIDFTVVPRDNSHPCFVISYVWFRRKLMESGRWDSWTQAWLTFSFSMRIFYEVESSFKNCRVSFEKDVLQEYKKYFGGVFPLNSFPSSEYFEHEPKGLLLFDTVHKIGYKCSLEHPPGCFTRFERDEKLRCKELIKFVIKSLELDDVPGRFEVPESEVKFLLKDNNMLKECYRCLSQLDKDFIKYVEGFGPGFYHRVANYPSWISSISPGGQNDLNMDGEETPLSNSQENS